MKRAGVRHVVVVAAVVLSGLLAGETGAAFRNPDGVAVIIGNRAYQYDVPEVTYAHRDAEAFRRYVVDVLGFDPENVIHQKDADKATMERVFGNRDSLTGSELWRHLHPDGISDVVVFYSGHGIPGLNDKRGYLLPVNAHPDTAELNGYPIDVLYDNLVKLKEQKAVRSVHVFLDACFSGDSGGGRLIGSTSAIRVAPLQASEGLEKLTILTAASGKEVASWDKTAKHGLFTHHLLNALYGEGDTDADGQVTAVEAKAYLDRHMTRAARRTFGRVQNADLRGVETAVLARAVGGMFSLRPLIGPAGQVGERFRDCPACPEMVVVPAGSFEMGSPASEAGRFAVEGPVHRVTIAEPLAVGVYEVTRGEFGRFVEATGYSFMEARGYQVDKAKDIEDQLESISEGTLQKLLNCNWRDPFFGTKMQGEREPVVCVSWADAQAYVQWLSQETGQMYRLLSEAEWEYVARAGTGTARYWGQWTSDQCQYENSADMMRMKNSIKILKKDMRRQIKEANSDADREILRGMYEKIIEEAAQENSVLCNDGYVYTSPVGTYKANAFGLHDMLGNVSEWVEDCWHSHYSDPFLMDYYNTFEDELKLKKFDSFDEFARSANAMIEKDPSLRDGMKSDMDRKRVWQHGSAIRLSAEPRDDRAPADGSAWKSGDCSVCVVRGGSSGGDPRRVRAAYRRNSDAGIRWPLIGFRVARTLTGSAATRQAAGQQQEAEARQQAEEARRKPESQESLLASLTQQMVHIEGGAFRMGCTEEQSSCDADEKLVHRVRVRSFALSKYEVTQALWEVVMGENPSHFENCALCPVENVSWEDIQTFLKKLNNLTGERYRLPTETEWEYAARGGQQSRGYRYAGSNEPGLVAWYRKNSGDRVHPVGEKQPNELGLYDMSGNLSEWVEDCWNESYSDAPSDGRAWQRGKCDLRILRGGSWGSLPQDLRSAGSGGFFTDYRNSVFGFRIARTLTP